MILRERLLPTYDERVAHVDLFEAPAATWDDPARNRPRSCHRGTSL